LGRCLRNIAEKQINHTAYYHVFLCFGTWIKSDALQKNEELNGAPLASIIVRTFLFLWTIYLAKILQLEFKLPVAHHENLATWKFII